MNSEILHKIPEYLEQMDKNSIISRIKGFFNFINFIWIISIIGIAVSIVPAIIYFSYPIMKIIFNWFLFKIIEINKYYTNFKVIN